MLSRVGDYEVVRELARGGMGVVYLARDPGLERDVALKVVAGAGLDAEGLERFRREGRAAARLRHPNVVCVHAVGALPGGLPYLVMDLVEGEPLRARVRRDGPLPPAEAARLVAVVARALDYAHGRGVLHRDLKPANVLVDHAGAPYLTDFGLARLLDRDTRVTATGEVMGTPVYMAPEQADGDHARVGPASDVYGLGAVLYELLTGQPPFQGLAGLAALNAVLTRPPTPPGALRPGLDPDLEAVVLRCLQKDPARRFASAAALAQALEDLAGARPATPRVRRAPRRGSSALALGLVTLLGAGAALLLERARRMAATEAATHEARAAAAAADAAREEATLATTLAFERARAAALVATTGVPAPGAMDLLAAATAAAPDDAARAELVARRVLVLLRRDTTADALEPDVRLLLARDPQDPVGLFGQAVLSHGGPDGTTARYAEALERVLHLAPDLAPALAARAGVRMAAGEVALAREDAERALELDPTLPAARAAHGDALLACGRRAEAVDTGLCAAALARGDDPATWRALAVTAIAAGDPVRARAALDRGLTLGEDLELLGLSASLALREGDGPASRAAAERALRLDPGHALARRLATDAPTTRDPRAAATDLASRGDPALAEALLLRVRGGLAAGEDPDLAAWLALVRLRLERHAEARAGAAAVLARAPRHAVARLVRAQLLAHDGDATAARALVEQVVADAPDLADARCVLAGLLEDEGDRGAARRAVDEALKLAPDLEWAVLVRAGLQEDARAAQEDAERVIKAMPGAARAWAVLARAHLELGRPAQALRAAGRSIALRDHPHPRLLRARLLLERGDPAAALEEVEAGLALGPRSPAALRFARVQVLAALERHAEALAAGEELLQSLPAGAPLRAEVQGVLERAR